MTQLESFLAEVHGCVLNSILLQSPYRHRIADRVADSADGDQLAAWTKLEFCKHNDWT